VKYTLGKTKLNPKNQFIENFSINFRLNKKADLYMIVLGITGTWKPYAIYHDHNGNKRTKLCPFCRESLKAGGVCVGLQDELNSIYKKILEVPSVRVKALFEGLFEMEE